MSLFRIAKSVTRSIAAAIRHDPEVERLLADHPRLTGFVRNRIGGGPFGLLLTVGAAVAIAFLLFFLSVVEDLVTRDPLVEADIRIVALVQGFRTPAMDQAMTFVTYLGNWQTVFAGVALVTAFFIILGRRTEIVALIASVAGGEALVWVIKALFHRARPEMVNTLASAQGPSFPSGHAFVAFSFYGLVAWFAIVSAGSRPARLAIGIAAILFMLTLGFSRIYLGVHWPTDVLASFALGAAWLTAVITAFHIHRAITVPARSDASTTGAWSAAFAALWLAFAVAFYAAHPLVKLPPRTVAPVALARGGFPADLFARVPRFSEDIVGRPMEPINVILVGREADVIAAFREAGWQPADPVNLRTVWRQFVAHMLDRPYPRAPGTPTFWLDTPNRQSFEKATEADSARERHHLHIWPTAFTVDGAPVSVSTVHRDRAVYTSLGVVSPFHDIDPAVDKERESLRHDLAAGRCVERIEEAQVTEPMLGENALSSAFFTDGKAIVAFLRCPG